VREMMYQWTDAPFHAASALGARSGTSVPCPRLEGPRNRAGQTYQSPATHSVPGDTVRLSSLTLALRRVGTRRQKKRLRK